MFAVRRGWVLLGRSCIRALIYQYLGLYVVPGVVLLLCTGTSYDIICLVHFISYMLINVRHNVTTRDMSDICMT